KAISPSSGYSKTFFLDRIWDHWIQTSNPTWSTFLQKYESEFKSFPILSFKINQYPSGPEGSITLFFSQDSPAETTSKKSFELVSGIPKNPSNWFQESNSVFPNK
ncbi:MAG: hypothetical protein MUE75_15435, partial [Algoriphagus sp.]|nr:hypothetical protein [Algoriphagus sp.]